MFHKNLFGFFEVVVETPEHSKDKFSELTPIFQKAEISFQDRGEYMQKIHNEKFENYIHLNESI